jgi:hypothetical protein
MARHTEHGKGYGTLKATEHRSEIWIADSAVWRADKGHRKEQSSEKSTEQRRAQSREEHRVEKSTEKREEQRVEKSTE